jgi:hypothetical protein
MVFPHSFVVVALQVIRPAQPLTRIADASYAIIFPVKPFGGNGFSNARSILTDAGCLEGLRA